jgi:uncharacterized protein
MTTLQGSYPYQVPIDAYGNGGFRFADMSHKGSLLCLPSGIMTWSVAAAPDGIRRSGRRHRTYDDGLGGTHLQHIVG